MTVTSPTLDSITTPLNLVLHLATEEEQDKAFSGKPYRTLCGIDRPYLRNSVPLLQTNPSTCIVCNHLVNRNQS